MENDRDLWKSPFGAALAAVVCLLAACSAEKGGTGAAEDAQAARDAAVILRVGEGAYTNADFLAYVNRAAGEESEALSEEALSRLFDRFLDEKILLEAARRDGVILTEEEKRAYLAKISSDPDSESPESGTGMNGGTFDRLVADKYVYQKLRGLDVTRAEIRTYYNEHKKDFLLAERVQVSQILYDTEEKAVSALRRLERASPDEFRRTAREESIGPEAAREGLMGVYKPGDLPADMEKVIFALPEGKISQVVESSYGFHIFRLDRKLFPHLQTEEEATPVIRLKVLDEKSKAALAAHLEELKGVLDWAVIHEELTFPYQRLGR